MKTLRLDEFRALVDQMHADVKARQRGRNGTSGGDVQRVPVMT